MYSFRIAFGLCLLILGTSPPATANQAVPKADRPVHIILKRISVDIPLNQKLGSRRAGVLCAPNGSLRGDFLASAVNDNLLELASRALVEVGVPVHADFSPTAIKAPSHLLIARVVAMDVDVCAPKSGYGSATALKAKGSVDVAWEIYAVEDDGPISTVRTRSQFRISKAQEGGGQMLLAEALRSNIHEHGAMEIGKVLGFKLN